MCYDLFGQFTCLGNSIANKKPSTPDLFIFFQTAINTRTVKNVGRGIASLCIKSVRLVLFVVEIQLPTACCILYALKNQSGFNCLLSRQVNIHARKKQYGEKLFLHIVNMQILQAVLQAECIGMWIGCIGM